MTEPKRNVEMVRKYSRMNPNHWIQKRWKVVCFITIVIIVFTLSLGLSFSIGFAWGTHRFRVMVEEGLSAVYNRDTHVAQDISNDSVDFQPFWDAWTLLDANFVGGASIASSTTSETISNQDKIWGAISGLTRAYGDPFTTFLPPEENENFEADISGEFTGVGMEIGNRNGLLTVISPLPGTPADRAGIRPKDIISKIGDVDSIKMPTEKAVKLIRGPKGEEVTVTVLRSGVAEPLEITIVRDVILIPTIETGTVGDVFVIKLYSFTASSPALFRDAIQKFAQSQKSKLIIDLRGNPGGYLEAAISMASWFLPEDSLVVTEKYGYGKESRLHYSEGYNIFNDNLRLVILTNTGSASASEILVGALRDHNKAILMGQTTYGKGSVQELFNLTKDTSLKITIAKWLTPSGRHISENGINPDVTLDPFFKTSDIEVSSYNTDFSTDSEIIQAVKVLDREDFKSLFNAIPDDLQNLTASSTTSL